MSLARSCNHPNMTPLWQPSQASQRLSSWHVLEVISREIRMSSCYLGLSWCQPRCTASWLFSSHQGTRRDFVFRLNCEALFWLAQVFIESGSNFQNRDLRNQEQWAHLMFFRDGHTGHTGQTGHRQVKRQPTVPQRHRSAKNLKQYIPQRYPKHPQGDQGDQGPKQSQKIKTDHVSI